MKHENKCKKKGKKVLLALKEKNLAKILEENNKNLARILGSIEPPPPTSDDLDIWRMLETVMTVQTTLGQILVDMLDELRALRADLEHLRRSPLPPPFDDVWLPFGIPSQKKGVHL